MGLTGAELRRLGRRSLIAGAGLAVAAAVAGCSSTAYNKPVQTLKSSLSAFSTARSGYADTYGKTADQAFSVADEKQLYSGAPLVVRADCVTQAQNALAGANRLLADGQSLDPLYRSGGAMTAAARCSVDVLPSADAAADPSAPAPADFDQAAANAEADADSATCAGRLAGKAATAPTGATGIKGPDADALWKTIDAYSDGLVSLSDADNDKAFKDAASGAAAAVKSLGAPLKSKTFGPAVDLLAAGFQAAIEQQRYEALKTAVICANPVFIRLRGTLRDSLRYEQIAAFSNLATRFHDQVGQMHSLFDPAPCTAGSPADAGCVVTQARQIIADPNSKPEQRFAALGFLQDRGLRLKSHLDAAQADARAAMALAATDPAGPVDSFIAAHRALRLAIVKNDGQLDALEASAGALLTAAKALDAAAKPAAAAAAK